MEEELKKLGIEQEVQEGKDGSYVITIENSDEWGKIFSKLDGSDLEDMEDNQLLTDNNSSLMFRSDKYQYNLLADFSANEYKLVITERG